MKSLALVIGINDYKNTTKLNNAVKDAEDISSKLESLGFEVLLYKDCDRDKLCEAVSTFCDKISSINENIVSLFYYSGHAIQIDGSNYLLPTNVELSSSSSAKFCSFPFDYVVHDVCKPNVQVKIFIMDACRNNPFSGDRGVATGGLAPIYAPKGSLIAFSTSPGETATDGPSGGNSIFTKALLTHIGVPNISIEECFKRVRESVYSLTNGKQLSWEHTSLIGTYYFNNGSSIYSKQIPYSDNVVKDELYTYNGTEFSRIICDLKSYDWYKQAPTIETIIKKTAADFPNKDEQFLLGRNILQVAHGGEFKIRNVFSSGFELDKFLTNWFVKDENHVLNGILYEMYFNKKAEFRGLLGLKDFGFEQICELSVQEKYKSSFDFINDVLTPFANYLIYIPQYSPQSISLDLHFTKTKFTSHFDGEKDVEALDYISKNGIKIIETNPDSYNYEEIKYSGIKAWVSQKLHIPQKYLIVCENCNFEDNSKIWVPKTLNI